MSVVVDPVGVAGLPAEPAAPLAAGASTHRSEPAEAVRDFESLFVETLLQHAGLAEALGGGGDAEGGMAGAGNMAGELMVRELARGLADQLQLGFGRYLGVEGAK